MDNQHQKITGYRELTQAEIDLMNEIKAKSEELMQLCGKTLAHINAQVAENSKAIDIEGYSAELNRISNAEPYEWYRRGREAYQLAAMYMVRAIAQPTTF